MVSILKIYSFIYIISYIIYGIFRYEIFFSFSFFFLSPLKKTYYKSLYLIGKPLLQKKKKIILNIFIDPVLIGSLY